MIKDYQDNAANERTYLTWVRTGITVAVFGFVIEKLNLFLEELPLIAAHPGSEGFTASDQIKVLSVLLVLTGIGVILLSTWHFVRTRHAIECKENQTYYDLLSACVLSGLLSGAGGMLLMTLLQLV